MSIFLIYNDFRKEYKTTDIISDDSKKVGHIQEKILSLCSLMIYNIEYSAFILKNDKIYILGSEELSFDMLFNSVLTKEDIKEIIIYDRKRDNNGNVIKENNYINKYNKWFQLEENENYIRRVNTVFQSNTLQNNIHLPIHSLLSNLLDLRFDDIHHFRDLQQNEIEINEDIDTSTNIHTNDSSTSELIRELNTLIDPDNINDPSDEISEEDNILSLEQVNAEQIRRINFLNNLTHLNLYENSELSIPYNDIISEIRNEEINTDIENEIRDVVQDGDAQDGDAQDGDAQDGDAQDGDLQDDEQDDNSDSDELPIYFTNSAERNQARQNYLYNLENENLRNILPRIQNYRNDLNIFTDILTYNMLITPIDNIVNNTTINTTEDVIVALTEQEFDEITEEHFKFTVDESHECLICVSDFEENDCIKKLKCSHCFHKDCIHRWLCKESNKCPVCRIEVAKGEPKNI